MVSDSNRLKFNTSFVEDGLSELPYKQSQRENFYKLAEMLVKRLDKVQNSVVALAYSRFLDLAEGELLDFIASHYFIERNGKSDDSLRSSIKLYALRQTTEPTRSDIVGILKSLTDNGFVKIYKGKNNYIEVVISVDCLTVQDLVDELSDLFPINTNLVVGSVPTGSKPFGVVSIHSNKTPKVGALSSIHNGVINRKNVTAVTIINDERDS